MSKQPKGEDIGAHIYHGVEARKGNIGRHGAKQPPDFLKSKNSFQHSRLQINEFLFSAQQALGSFCEWRFLLLF